MKARICFCSQQSTHSCTQGALLTIKSRSDNPNFNYISIKKIEIYIKLKLWTINAISMDSTSPTAQCTKSKAKMFRSTQHIVI